MFCRLSLDRFKVFVLGILSGLSSKVIIQSFILINLLIIHKGFVVSCMTHSSQSIRRLFASVISSTVSSYAG